MVATTLTTISLPLKGQVIKDNCLKEVLMPKKQNKTKQERERERELIPHIGLILKVIPLKLFLDMAPSSPTDVNSRCVDVFECCL